MRPSPLLRHRAEDVTDEEAAELTVRPHFWLARGHESLEQWLKTSKTTWARSYSWHREKRKALQSECEREVRFPRVATTTTNDVRDLLEQFEDWLGVRRQQWRLERRKRQRRCADPSATIARKRGKPTCSHSDGDDEEGGDRELRVRVRVGGRLAGGALAAVAPTPTTPPVRPPRLITNDGGTGSRGGASPPAEDYAANDSNPCTATSNKYLDEIIEDQAHLSHNEATRQPMDITWIFDSQLGAPDMVIMSMMMYLRPSDHGNLLCLSFASNYLFRQRNDMWRAMCPRRWVLPRRPRKSWCSLYILKIRAEEETSRKRADDVLVKANVIIHKGDQLHKLEKLVGKAQRDFDFPVSYTSGVVLERNSLLNMAAIEKRHKIVKWLVEREGADIESCDRGGFTPLLNAAWNGDKYIIRYLLKRGCDRTKVGFNHLSQGLAPASFEGLNAEGWARKRGYHEVSELIRLGL